MKLKTNRNKKMVMQTRRSPYKNKMCRKKKLTSSVWSRLLHVFSTSTAACTKFTQRTFGLWASGHNHSACVLYEAKASFGSLDMCNFLQADRSVAHGLQAALQWVSVYKPL